MYARQQGPQAEPHGSDLLVLDDATEPRGLPAVVARRRRGRRVLAGVLVVALLLIGATATALFVATESLGNNVARVPDVFGDLDAAARPADSPALTFLLVGSDSRADAPTTGAGATADGGSERSDVLMLARVDPARTGASVVSIPRDSWVDIPGHGENKINAAYAFGGPSLLVRTVEQLTGIRVDHLAVIDFAGFRAMVDAVGGIRVRVAEATENEGVRFHQGVNELDGAAALAYVRQRHGLPRGDIDRAARQQNALRALLDKAASAGMLTDPVPLYRLLDAVSRSVSVDDTLSNGGIRELGFEVRGLRPSGLTFVGAPVRGLGREGDQSVVYLDDARSSELWNAVQTDALAAYTRRNPTDTLGETPP
ncbi:LCP family protein [Pseudonocardia kunmingensis]|uniref:LytR family transcriptional attenuator n=1 Tax=Pseudonocardia kunmingensis TaxID=630975 RepID=A0A543DZM7_9PSEU|nr:LCP family protein [Pseudonocardia kunmingensis]TQM14797.1 LytR family transcriptional attenuator [Pseudonocardia kunmingensis]